MRDTEIVIIGGGPAGSLAATLLAGQGRSVILLDRAQFPRPKLCGGYLSRKSHILIRHALGVSLDKLRTHGVVDYVSPTYEIAWKQHTLDIFDQGGPHVFVRREVFDDFLLGRARKAGAVVRTGIAVEAVDPDTGTVRLSGFESVRGRIVLAADGANSLVRRTLFPQERRKWRQNLAGTVEARFSMHEAKFRHPMIHLGLIRWGYGWVFPNADSVVVGMCGLRERNSRPIADCFQDYLKCLGLSDTKPRQIGSYPLPYGNWLAEPVRGRAMLVGDAAGMCDPVFGEGIFFAMLSGALAAEAVATTPRGASPEVVGAAYVRLYREHILSLFESGLVFRRLIYSGLTHLPVRLSRLAIGLARPYLLDMVHGDRSFDGKRRTPCPPLTVFNS